MSYTKPFVPRAEEIRQLADSADISRRDANNFLLKKNLHAAIDKQIGAGMTPDCGAVLNAVVSLMFIPKS